MKLENSSLSDTASASLKLLFYIGKFLASFSISNRRNAAVNTDEKDRHKYQKRISNSGHSDRIQLITRNPPLAVLFKAR